MKILFLDDDEQRHAQYTQRSVGHDVRHVRTAAQAIQALTLYGPYDVADLDHDLGGFVMVSPGAAGHGLDVAEFLALNPGKARTVIVHSYNQRAAMAMLRALRATHPGSQWAPFGELWPNG